ncbi:alpha/beta-hydrolase [Daldinia grandis]|nr:alpha/beta-hydrolase [Daldinia grandis]
MANRNPALVFSPGAWHTPEYFQPTTSRLTEAGFPCDTVSLPSIGSELKSPGSPSIPQSFDADVAAIRGTVLKHLDAGRDVVLIVHSYSGVVGSEAVAGLDAASRSRAGESTAVIHLIYVAALLVDVGAQLWPTGSPAVPDQVRVEGDLVYSVPEKLDEVFYGRCTPAQRELLVRCQRSHARGAFTSPTTHAAWRVIPTTYVKAREDPLGDFLAQPQAGHRFEEVVEVAGGHFPFVTATEEVVGVIKRVVEKSTRVA